MTGFEPTLSRTRTERFAKLSYIPKYERLRWDSNPRFSGRQPDDLTTSLRSLINILLSRFIFWFISSKKVPALYSEEIQPKMCDSNASSCSQSTCATITLHSRKKNRLKDFNPQAVILCLYLFWLLSYYELRINRLESVIILL